MKTKNNLIKIILISLTMLLFGVSLSFALPKNFKGQEIYTSSSGSKKIIVIVNSNLYAANYDPALKEKYDFSLRQYLDDLEAEDYRVTLTKYPNAGIPQELKDYINDYYNISKNTLQGVVMIGELPIAYSRLKVNMEYLDYFPCDLFYMDLDGTWVKTYTNDGTYAEHKNKWWPEIWLGRITASRLQYTYKSEAELLKIYFAKNHAYRVGKMSAVPQQNALMYIDDVIVDEEQNNRRNGNFLKGAYPISAVSVRKGYDETSPSDYKERISGAYGTTYEIVHLVADSFSEGHLFKFHNSSPETISETFSTYDIPGAKALFYVLECPSACRYDVECMGNYYLFAPGSLGLAVIGSTREVSFNKFALIDVEISDFYELLSVSKSRKTLGEAFKYWFGKRNFRLFIYPQTHGFTLLGDPTLSLDPPRSSIDTISPDSIEEGKEVTFIGSARLASGTIRDYYWRLDNDNKDISNNSNNFKISQLAKGEHTVYLKAKDDKGRWSSEDKRVFTVAEKGKSKTDFTAPTSEFIFISNPRHRLAGQWYNKQDDHATFYFRASDGDGSGVDKILYSLDNSDPRISAAVDERIDLSQDGLFAIKYRAQDKENNQENIRAANKVIRIDRTPPKTQLTTITGDDVVSSDWYKGPLTFKLTASDEVAGVNQVSGVYNTSYSFYKDGNTDNIQGPYFYFAPIELFEGVYTFLYHSEDAAGNIEAEQTKEIKIGAPNSPPLIKNKDLVVNDGETININLHELAADSNGDKLSYKIVTPPQHAKEPLKINVDTVVYRSVSNYSGSDFFEFIANDGKTDSGKARVNININDINHSPTKPQGLKVAKNGLDSIDIAWDASTDADGNAIKYHVYRDNVLTKTITKTSYHDAGLDPKLVYIYKVKAQDDSVNLLTSEESDSLPARTKNQAPLAHNLEKSLLEDRPVEITLVASDSNGDRLNFIVPSSKDTGPKHGTLIGTAPNFTYEPYEFYHGPDSFKFKVNDGELDSKEAEVKLEVMPTPTPQGTVTLQRCPTNLRGALRVKFVLRDDASGLNEWRIRIYKEVAGRPLVSARDEGPFTDLHSVSREYDLELYEQLGYSKEYTCEIEIFNNKYKKSMLISNRLKMPSLYPVFRDGATTATVTNYAGNLFSYHFPWVLYSDSNRIFPAEGDAGKYVCESLPPGWVVQRLPVPDYIAYYIEPIGGKLKPEHKGNFTVFFKATTANGESATFTLHLNIREHPDGNRITVNSLSCSSPIEIALSGKGEYPLTYQVPSSTELKWGRLSAVSGDKIIYTPNANLGNNCHIRSDSFIYSVIDSTGEIGSGKVTINIGVNHPPIAKDRVINWDYVVGRDGASLADILLEATDSDGDRLSYAIVDTLDHPKSSRVRMTTNNRFDFLTSKSDSSLIDEKVYFKVNDGWADSNIATIRMVLKPVPEGPHFPPTPIDMGQLTARSIGCQNAAVCSGACYQGVVPKVELSWPAWPEDGRKANYVWKNTYYISGSHPFQRTCSNCNPVKKTGEACYFIHDGGGPGTTNYYSLRVEVDGETVGTYKPTSVTLPNCGSAKISQLQTRETPETAGFTLKTFGSNQSEQQEISEEIVFDQRGQKLSNSPPQRKLERDSSSERSKFNPAITIQ